MSYNSSYGTKCTNLKVVYRFTTTDNSVLGFYVVIKDFPQYLTENRNRKKCRYLVEILKEFNSCTQSKLFRYANKHLYPIP